MSVYSLHKDQLFPTVFNKLKPANIVLDIGCGIYPQQRIKPLVHICCEPFDQYVGRLQDKIQSEFDRGYVVVKATWAEAIKLFPPKSVDTIFLVDVIEHLDKTEGLQLLKATEKLARQQVVVFTPLGFLPQYHADGKDAWGMDGGAWQEHKSGWLPEDFDDLWDLYVANEFHAEDNLGNKFDEPYGAFWAVKTLERGQDGQHAVQSKRERIRSLVEMAADIQSDVFLTLLILPIHVVTKIKSLLRLVRSLVRAKLSGTR